MLVNELSSLVRQVVIGYDWSHHVVVTGRREYHRTVGGVRKSFYAFCRWMWGRHLEKVPWVLVVESGADPAHVHGHALVWGPRWVDVWAVEEWVRRCNMGRIMCRRIADYEQAAAAYVAGVEHDWNCRYVEASGAHVRRVLASLGEPPSWDRCEELVLYDASFDAVRRA